MCGLAGLIDLARATSGGALREQATAMAATLRHRGPDSSGEWCDEAAGIALAHRRLAIVDLSEHGHQPMTSRSGRYVIAFNGEVYNYAELAAELQSEEWRQAGSGDTEVMLAAFEAWGVERAIDRFVGMFAFALWDRQQRRLHLVRDRLGVKPMYFARCGRMILFGSELRALSAHPSFVTEIDQGAVSLFLRFGYVPAPRSIWRSAEKLLPGTHLTIDGEGRLESRTYWSLRDRIEAAQRDPFLGDEREAIDETERLLRDSVRLRMVADVPLGVLLSGGVDSSAVAALAQAESSGRVRTFTIGLPVESFDEAKSAAAVAKHLGTDHTELTVTAEDALAAVPAVAAAYDEPFADSSQLPTYLVCGLARRQVTVCLSGDGGDELFAGYTRHLWGGGAERVADALPAGVRTWIGDALASLPAGAVNRGAGLVEPLLPRRLRVRGLGDKVNKLGRALSRPSSMYRSLVSHWPEPGEVVAGLEPETVLDRPGDWPRLKTSAERAMYLDTVTYLPDDILTKVDRASMAVSLEAREPLLDHRLVEFAWRLPHSMKVRGGLGKWALRQVLYRHVPPALIDRPKWGFSIPVQQWLRTSLRDWAEDLLDERQLRADGILQPAPIRALWQQTLAGASDPNDRLWTILMFQSWRRQQPAMNLARSDIVRGTGAPR